MKKLFITLLIITLLLLSTGCNKKQQITIAIPNDTTNEARALLLLQNLGLITLKEGASILATINDIVDNPYDIKFNEVEAAQLPNI
jgi:D-methionine transport system substrate-binding protein